MHPLTRPALSIFEQRDWAAAMKAFPFVNGNGLDTYADDLGELTAFLDLSDAIHIGHSTGGDDGRPTGRDHADRLQTLSMFHAVAW